MDFRLGYEIVLLQDYPLGETVEMKEAGGIAGFRLRMERVWG